ncbi:MAG: DUF4395 family protein [Thermaerobacterales bacterium]
MNEIPIPLIRANQAFLVSMVLLAALLGQPWPLAAALLIQAAPLVLGRKAHLIFALTRPALAGRIKNAATEAAELQRFNQILAVLFLVLSLASFTLGQTNWGWIFAGLLAAAAGLAMAGFCIGCTIYLRWKLFRSSASARHKSE